MNGLDVAARVDFSAAEGVAASSAEVGPLGLPDRALVAMGGGKDSLVALDMLREVGLELTPVCVGTRG